MHETRPIIRNYSLLTVPGAHTEWLLEEIIMVSACAFASPIEQVDRDSRLGLSRGLRARAAVESQSFRWRLRCAPPGVNDDPDPTSWQLQQFRQDLLCM